jgi:hypothetical protein
MKILTEIANKWGTDKGFEYREGHGFTEFYNDIFNEYKEKAEKENRKLNILEIGVWEGCSVKMLNEFFGDSAKEKRLFVIKYTQIVSGRFIFL